MSSDLAVGFGCIAVTIACLGSNFVPVKRFEIGDGMFFQFMQAIGIWTVAIVVQLIRGSVFESYAMLGGVLWAMGNALCGVMIKCIGMALGQQIYGAVASIVGWSMGFWGWFGVEKSEVKHLGLNVAGALTGLIGTVVFFYVRPAKSLDPDLDDVARSLVNEEGGYELSKTRPILEPATWVDNLNKDQKRVTGIVFALFTGAMIGMYMAPPTHLVGDNHSLDNHGLHYSSNGLDYVFSVFSGVLLTASTIFLVYCIARNNDPWISGDIILPGWISGLLWGIGQTTAFIANDKLGLLTVYPMMTIGPGLVATMWGLFVFKEVKGRRDLTVLLVAFTLTCLAVTLLSLSKALQ